jgi:hypothetical protein
MSIICTVWGHNWVLQSNMDGTAKWQQCVRCGKENASISAGRVM